MDSLTSPAVTSNGKAKGHPESERIERLEGLDRTVIQPEIRRAIWALRLAQEILTGLTKSNGGTTMALLSERATALGVMLTRAELDAVTRFLEGESPEEIADERGLSPRTVSNQTRTGCRRLGFTDRRELKGWWTAASGYILTRPPELDTEGIGEEP